MVDLYPDQETARARKKEFFEPANARQREWCKKLTSWQMLPPEEVIHFQKLVFGPSTEELLIDYVSKEMKGHLDFMEEENERGSKKYYPED